MGQRPGCVLCGLVKSTTVESLVEICSLECGAADVWCELGIGRCANGASGVEERRLWCEEESER